MILMNIDARDPILDHASISSQRGAGGRLVVCFLEISIGVLKA
jgi:hypothetical protein